MKITHIKTASFFIGCSLMMGCSKMADPLGTEQYAKSVYLVGANQSNNEGMQIMNIAYKASADETADSYISVATGGSQLIDKDLAVQVGQAGNAAVAQYNAMHRYKSTDIKYQLLNGVSYKIPDSLVNIKAGGIYGNMPIQIKTAGLHCDSAYALTFRIASVSDPSYAPIRTKDTVLLFSFKLFNQYSGSYQATGRYYKYGVASADTISLALVRTLTAVNFNTVRFYHLATTEEMKNLTASGVTIRVNSDKSLTFSSWGSLVIKSSGGSYDAINQRFYFWYNYMADGVENRFEGNFAKSSL
ncbi:BT_3044 domain-containing protein [Filimonas effusa]|nr:DUF4361 domain-containing protein [Filimonas effusa]